MAQSEIPGSTFDLQLPRAYRSLPRPLTLLEPSHPLGGLKILVSFKLASPQINRLSAISRGYHGALALTVVLCISSSKNSSQNEVACQKLMAATKAPSLHIRRKGLYSLPEADTKCLLIDFQRRGRDAMKTAVKERSESIGMGWESEILARG